MTFDSPIRNNERTLGHSTFYIKPTIHLRIIATAMIIAYNNVFNCRRRHFCEGVWCRRWPHATQLCGTFWAQFLPKFPPSNFPRLISSADTVVAKRMDQKGHQTPSNWSWKVPLSARCMNWFLWPCNYFQFIIIIVYLFRIFSVLPLHKMAKNSRAATLPRQIGWRHKFGPPGRANCYLR